MNMTLESEEERIERLKKQVSILPKRPGVYFMRDSKHDVIYVGKAKDLRSRVKNYFSGSDERLQVTFLLKKISVLEKNLETSKTPCTCTRTRTRTHKYIEHVSADSFDFKLSTQSTHTKHTHIPGA